MQQLVLSRHASSFAKCCVTTPSDHMPTTNKTAVPLTFLFVQFYLLSGKRYLPPENNELTPLFSLHFKTALIKIASFQNN